MHFKHVKVYFAPDKLCDKKGINLIAEYTCEYGVVKYKGYRLHLHSPLELGSWNGRCMHVRAFASSFLRTTRWKCNPTLDCMLDGSDRSALLIRVCVQLCIAGSVVVVHTCLFHSLLVHSFHFFSSFGWGSIF